MTAVTAPSPLRTPGAVERQYGCQLRDILVALRYHLRLNVAETARELQVPVSTASRWLREQEVEPPTWERATRAQEFLG